MDWESRILLLAECKRKKIKQKDLAELLQVSSSYISQWANNKVTLNLEQEEAIKKFIEEK